MLPSGGSFKVCQLVLGDEYPIVDYLQSIAGDPPSFGTVVDGMRRLSDPRWAGPPHTAQLKGKPYKGIFELRMMSGNRYMRLPFIHTSSQEIVLLFGETKKKAMPTIAFMEKARRYRDKIKAKEATYDPIDFTQFDE